MIAEILKAEYVVAADRAPQVDAHGGKVVAVDASSCPVIETVLEEAVAACSGDWILRLDDDETVSLAMLHCLLRFDFSDFEAVAFPRAHLWGSEQQALTNADYWPDVQMRLSRRHLAVRRVVHEAPPKIDCFVPACILHHVYLVRDRDARKECAERYCRIQGVPMPDPPRYWPSDYLDITTSPVFDGALTPQ
jgi:hypothetical protein